MPVMSDLNGYVTTDALEQPRSFRIRRPRATTIGSRPAIDARVLEYLGELDGLLRKAVFAPDAVRETDRQAVPRARMSAEDNGSDPDEESATESALAVLLRAPLTPRRVFRQGQPGVGRWDEDSVAAYMSRQQAGDGEVSLGELLESDSEVATLKYQFETAAERDRDTVDPTLAAVLGFSGVRDLLLARALTRLEAPDLATVWNFVCKHRLGAREVIQYAAVSAARRYVFDHKLSVPNVHKDEGAFATSVRDAGLRLTDDSFETGVHALVQDFLYDAQWVELIRVAGFEGLSPDMKARVIARMKASSIPITEENAASLVPTFVAQASAGPRASSGRTRSGRSPRRFDVTFFTDDRDQVEISASAVQCAAQLFYVLTLGDELGVFDAVQHFTHRYLFREGFAIEDDGLRLDLENYVLSQQFPVIDEETGEERMVRCTLPRERRSFYRQVFDWGDEPVPGEGSGNDDFGRIWKILMLESTKYLERAQSSPHPDAFVSPQNVMQAAEDLQYNLSLHCVGMATVISPLMYAELDFVINRILRHPEVRTHLVPSGGSWLKVIERLHNDRTGRRPRASVLDTKARVGYSIIRAVADYTPASFEDERVFSDFISSIEAFITSQSILQEEASSARQANGGPTGQGSGPLPGMPDLGDLPGMPSIPGVNAPFPGAQGPGGTGGSDEWDF